MSANNIERYLRVPVREAIGILEECDQLGIDADREYESVDAASEGFEKWQSDTADAMDRTFTDSQIALRFRSGLNVLGTGRRATQMFDDRRFKLLELLAQLILVELNDHRPERLARSQQLHSEDAILLVENTQARRLMTWRVHIGEVILRNAPQPQSMSDKAYQQIEDQERTFRASNLQLLRTVFDRNSVADNFHKLTTPFEYRVSGRHIDWQNLREVKVNEGTDPKAIVIERIRRQVNELVRLRSTLDLTPSITDKLIGNMTRISDPTVTIAGAPASKVFVVHGHEPGLRAEVARLIEKLGLEAIILEEQPNAGATLIEKLEKYSDVHFAIVLVTGDDVGAAKNKPTSIQLRARQNVIFELGYFVGSLGRNQVALLVQNGVEMLSDFHGVVYHPLDLHGAWKISIAKELRSAGFDVDMNRLV